MKKVLPNVRKSFGKSSNVQVVRRVFKPPAPIAQNVNTPVSSFQQILKQKIVSETTTLKCFVCDEVIAGRGFPLTMASTLSTKTSLPNKIGRLMGDGFMVVVSVEDVICKRCSSLFNHMDRLESELDKVTNTLSGYLKVKYKLSDDESESPPNKIAKRDHDNTADNSVCKNNVEGANQQDIENQLSHMFGSPMRVTPKEEPKVKQLVKMYKCVSCDFKTTDLSLFQPHYETCKPHKCKQCDKSFKDLKTLQLHFNEVHKSVFTCTQCNIAYMEECTFKKHMETHMESDRKMTHTCPTCQFKTNDRRIFEIHLKEHTNVKAKPFKCRTCAQRFCSREEALVHTKTHQPAPQTAPTYFRCGLCSCSFQRKENLEKHTETQHKAKPTITGSTTNTVSTQRLLQASIEEALRDTNMEAEASTLNQQDGKQIEFYTCNPCSLTFLNENIFNQHQKQHIEDKKIAQGPTQGRTSLIRQEVRNTNVSILNSTAQGNALTESDLESMFEKMHSDNASQSATTLPAVTTTDSAGNITFKINIGEEATNGNSQSGSSNNQKKHENVLIFKCETCNEAYADNDHLQLHWLTSGHGSVSPASDEAPIDMPALDPDETPDNTAAQTTPNKVLDNGSNSADTNASAENKNIANSGANSRQSGNEESDHVTESNTEHVPMELEDMNAAGNQNELKLMLDADNQLITSDGQILQLDGTQIITDADGNQIMLQGGNEQLQHLLQNAGVVVHNEDGEEMQLMDNSQMILIQDENGEHKLINSSMLDGSNIISIQDGEGGDVHMTLEQAQAAGIDISHLLESKGDEEDSQEAHEGEEKGTEDNAIGFNLDELCHLQTDDGQQEIDQSEQEENQKNTSKRKMFLCGECGYSTKLRASINIHMTANHPMCISCRTVFDSSEQLLKHTARCPKANRLGNLELMHLDSSDLYPSLSTDDILNINSDLKLPDNVVVDFRKSSLINPQPIPLFNNNDDDNYHLKDSNPNQPSNVPMFQCIICSDIFPSEDTCNNHIQLSHMEVKCNFCDLRFPDQRALKTHKKIVHPILRLQCSTCGKQLSSQATLNNHEALHSSFQMLYECTECHRNFKTSLGLQNHLARHNGTFDFNCDSCKLGFSSMELLRQHIRRKHVKRELFMCEVCGLKFKLQGTYWLHRKWHDKPYPYKCDTCGEQFKRSSVMAVHKRKHTGLRPYQCSFCNMSFSISSSLKRHMISHNRNYPYGCNICGKGFAEKYKYTVHVTQKRCRFASNAKPRTILMKQIVDAIDENLGMNAVDSVVNTNELLSLRNAEECVGVLNSPDTNKNVEHDADFFSSDLQNSFTEINGQIDAHIKNEYLMPDISWELQT